jgi:hypothetical protein
VTPLVADTLGCDTLLPSRPLEKAAACAPAAQRTGTAAL